MRTRATALWRGSRTPRPGSARAETGTRPARRSSRPAAPEEPLPLEPGQAVPDADAGSARATGSAQKVRPTTDASWIARFSGGGSQSIRARRGPRERCPAAREPGAGHRHPADRPRARALPRRSGARRISSRNSGLPSACPRIWPRSPDGSSAPDRSPAMSSWLSAVRQRIEPRSSPRPRIRRKAPGATRPNSGRAVATSSTGPCGRIAERCSISRSWSSAQWRSSNTRTSGPRAASAVTSRGQARAICSPTSSGSILRAGSPASGSPAVAARAYVGAAARRRRRPRGASALRATPVAQLAARHLGRDRRARCRTPIAGSRRAPSR